MRTLISLTALALTGCVSILPEHYALELEHISHPTVGWPVDHSAHSEDGLTQVNVIVHWERNNKYIEHSLGYNLQGRDGGGFYGPSLTYTGRIGVKFGGR